MPLATATNLPSAHFAQYIALPLKGTEVSSAFCFTFTCRSSFLHVTLWNQNIKCPYNLLMCTPALMSLFSVIAAVSNGVRNASFNLTCDFQMHFTVYTWIASHHRNFQHTLMCRGLQLLML